MNAIVCTDENWGIGKDNDLLISIPDDMKFFVEKTKGNIIVYGRKTLFSFKNKSPLKNRLNIVFSKDNTLVNEYNDYDNLIFVKNKDELINILSNLDKKYRDYSDKEVFVCGGESIYRLLVNNCKKIYVTKVYKEFDADTFFPNLDEDSKFKIKNKSEIYEYNGIKYQFLEYVNEEI